MIPPLSTVEFELILTSITALRERVLRGDLATLMTMPDRAAAMLAIVGIEQNLTDGRTDLVLALSQQLNRILERYGLGPQNG